MAVVVTLSKGFDLEYMWRQVDASAVADPSGYYIRDAESGAEPPGRWWGPGAEALGLKPGQVVERGAYDLLFGERKAPDGTRLGRPPSRGRAAADIYAGLLAAEPHATSERRRELRVEAAARARQGPLYFDLTISLSKSVSVFHASLGENARLARLAGDAEGAAYWAGLVGEAEEMIWRAVHAGLGYFQREAGYTRTGSHAGRAAGRETGQWHEADLAAALWLQHTSRDGDMQLHVHSQIAHVARTARDGRWRAPDSFGYNEHLGAVAAIVAQHLEEALTRRFGVDWTARDDGHGFEIKGISGDILRVFSSRRESITAEVRERARAFAARNGREPSQRELARIAQASNFATRARKDAHPPGPGVAHARWASRLDRATGIALASVAPSVWGERAAGAQKSIASLNGAVLREAALKALALAQRDKAAFTRADVLKYLGRVLPRTGMNPDAAAALLEDLADRALGGEFEPVACLQAPEPADVPACLRRADGRSVHQRHGGVRYATAAHLSLEERLVAVAGAGGAPALPREAAARLLGASVTQLGALLARGPRDADIGVTRDGLRADQAAAAFAALTGTRRATVINAPAGSGKTRVLGAAARTWTHAGTGRVVGITPSQSSRNTLAALVPESYNTARFLGHLPARRGALGPVPLEPGSLVLVDEASMVSTADLADVVSHAAASGAKVIIAGDTAQLQAVENGGGMTLLTNSLGCVRLAEPVRFTAPWERAASLRLRDGDATVLAEYDEHGRITGGDPEDMLDAAARAYVALALDGTDVLLIAADHARRRELSRRIRDDLTRLGVVARGPSARIGDGQSASAGDLVVCTRNDHTVEAGEPGRTLANGDLLKVVAVTSRGLLVRRALPADPETGRRQWTGRTFTYGNLEDCELGYAVTSHVAQSRTVHTGLALITGTEDRQHAYVALTRGTHANHAYVFTTSPKTADPAPGPRPAPELGRYDRLAAARDGQPAPAEDNATREQATGVLAAVLGRDGQEPSATQARRDALANADHLAVLHAIWADLVTPARDQQYRHLLDAVLPAQYQGQDSHRARWLWRTLHAAELAGLDPAAVLRDTLGEKSLAGARDATAVLDARIRRRLRDLAPQAPRPWSGQVPDLPDPELRDYLAQIARLMDERAQRIGEHTAAHPPPWATAALGPVPGNPAARHAWQQKASVIGAYREMHGYDHPADPIGPEPPAGAPGKRAAWHHALAALGPADSAGVRGLPDGALLHLRDTYPIDTAWAPRWTGDALRQVRHGARDAALAATRARAEATAAATAGRTAAAARHAALAASYQAMARAYRQREETLAAVMDDRRAWDHATAERRRQAVAADAELRRRHPGQHHPPLRSAEPEPPTPAQRASLTLTPGKPIPDTPAWLTNLDTGRADHVHADPVLAGAGLAWAPWAQPGQEALLQPPRPAIPPSVRVLERARVPERVRERQAEAEPEAGA